MDAKLIAAEGELGKAISAATSLGITENTIDGQMQFIDSLTDTLDSGVSSMVDADMEEEAARLQAYQVQQQLATQSLSIANQAPQNILSLFR
nr:flagellin [Sulfitobacter pontiacus]